MKILVERLRATPQRFTFEGGRSWGTERIPAGRQGSAIHEPFQIEVDAHTLGEKLFLDGAISGALDLECSRCVARYRHEFREPFQWVLEPARDRVPADLEGAEALARDNIWLSDELDTGWYRDSELELESLLLELISLALPVQPLCREDCQGLCPRCGAERAAGSCGCSTSAADSPFSVLAKLQNRQVDTGQEEGES